ncbi:hypothetical protein RP20_CCG015885 [Aedes albopictus]|nr:hypothetical protein RP20_CCG015885 [Aedes albopictus]
MQAFRLFLAILASRTLQAFPTISPIVINYSLTAIEHLAQHSFGQFECIFVDIGPNLYDDHNGFQEIINSPRLSHIVRYVINDSFVTEPGSGFPRAPSLMVVNLHREKHIFHSEPFADIVFMINPNTRILILFEKSYSVSVVGFLMDFFRDHPFTRIVCIESTNRVFLTVGFDGRITDYLEYLEPAELFRNILYDMAGRTIRYSGISRPSYGNDKWVQGTAEYLNTTSEFFKNPCGSAIRWMDSCFETFVNSMDITITMDCVRFKKLIPMMYRSLFKVTPSTQVFAVPTPRSLNVLEMFSWPFSAALWILLAVMAISLELLHLLRPNLFQNDPLLRIICGFERSSLHNAGFQERLIVIPLIIFFFVITSAYETRIISYMVNKPSIKKIETIPQLIQSGLKLSECRATSPIIFEDPAFSEMLVETNATSIKLDGESVYYGRKDYMEWCVRIPLNYDFVNKRPAYYILPETHGEIVCFYWLPTNDPLLEMFHYTQRIFYEAGLLDKWEQDEFADYYRFYLYEYGRFGYETKKNILNLRDMLPAWLALGMGYLVSVIMLIGELGYRSVLNITLRL